MEKLFLQNPDELAIDDAYRSLPKLGHVNVSVKAEEQERTLSNLESSGFVGITLSHFSAGNSLRRITAFKGKHGPCYDKGQQAVYTGAAAAALDDDHHLLLQSQPLPVCEKTARVLSLPPYEPLIRLTEPGSRIHSGEPEYFKYDHMEKDHETLLEKVTAIKRADQRISLFYPGPFRLLILSDGTIVRRGKITSVPQSDSRELKKTDGLFYAGDQPEGEQEFYQDKYAKKGTQWMFGDFVVGEKSLQPVTTDFTVLSEISEKMKEKLIQLIGKGNGYFILTGSDPADRLGCCPSDEVAEANRLVQAGILEACSQADYVNSCPVTFYAFKEEIKSVSGEIEFGINPVFRQEVLENMTQKRREGIKQVIKWVILAFVIISVLIGIYKIVMNFSQAQNKTFFERLASTNGDQTLVLLFHYHKRCYQCLNMEKYSREILESDFQREMKNNQVAFKLVDMDLPENRQTVREFGFISPMVVLVDLEKGKEKKIRVIGDAWKFFNDEQRFKALLREELDQFIAERNE